MNRAILNSGCAIAGAFFLPIGIGVVSAQTLKSQYKPYPHVKNITEGISWPKGQGLPTFATPAKNLDTIHINDLSKDEQLTFAALQGRVNSKQPRILLGNERSDEGSDTWADTKSIGWKNRKAFNRGNRYDLIAKYAKELDGVVLYDPAKSPHYRNLASTAAGLKNALPVIAPVYEEMQKAGVRLKVVEDLTKLEFTTPLEIYGHMYEQYWPKCERRLIVSAKPHDEKGGGDYHHTRDMASAVGAAVIWLDTLIPEERAMFGQFFKDMKAGEGVALGWYSTERSGVTAAAEFGIGLLPADFYLNSTVFSGTDNHIQIPAVPKKPKLDKKVYVALIVSDGDNIQYTQRAMRKNWDRSEDVRGKIPLSWTIAPGLVDIGPGILNYYYTSASPNDCFVTGPSGMGYMMPYNTLTEPGAPIGEYLKDPERMDGYTQLTETYLQRSGLRVVTVWDELSPMHRKSYEKHGRSLYGVTVQNFKDVPEVASSIENDHLRFEKLVIPYVSSYEHLSGSMIEKIKGWNGKEPMFMAYQVDVWGKLGLANLVDLEKDLAERFPDQVEFVRADHYFNLFNEANELSYNLAMSPDIVTKTGDGNIGGEVLMDGTPNTVWTSSTSGKQWVGFDFGAEHRINRYVIRHAGDGGLDPSQNTKEFAFQVSLDGKSWRTVNVVKGNKDNVTDIDFPQTRARYVKFLINDPGSDSKARIADVEIYGKK